MEELKTCPTYPTFKLGQLSFRISSFGKVTPATQTALHTVKVCWRPC